MAAFIMALLASRPFLIETMQRLGNLMLLGATAYSLASRVDEIGEEHGLINAAIQAARPEDAGLAARTIAECGVRKIGDYGHRSKGTC